MPEFSPEHTPPEVDDFVGAYLDAAEWLLDDDIDRDSVKGWAPEAIVQAQADCDDFRRAAETLLRQAYDRDGYGGEVQAGHDFWLTQNGHGAGFWDRGALQAGGLGDALSKVAKTFSGCDVCQGEDGLLYFT